MQDTVVCKLRCNYHQSACDVLNARILFPPKILYEILITISKFLNC